MIRSYVVIFSFVVLRTEVVALEALGIWWRRANG
jgi:hypothetical protein